MPSMIETRSVVVEYPSVRRVLRLYDQGVSLKLDQGDFLAVLGVTLVIGSPGAVLVVFLLGIPANLLIRHEERTLELRFGAEYRAYRESVPRWIPRRPNRHR